MDDLFLEKEYNNLVRFANYRIHQLHLNTICGQDLVHMVLCKIESAAPENTSNKPYLLQAINNFSKNICRKEKAKYSPSSLPTDVLEALAENTNTILEDILEEEQNISNTEKKHLLFSLIQDILTETKASKTICRLLDPTGDTFFPMHKTKELADRVNLSPSTITNNLSLIRKKFLPIVKERFQQQIM